MSEITFPTEVVELPSKGLLYKEGSPLRSGQVEIYYPTAKTEDILTNQNYIEKGVVVDKFLQSLIVDPKIDFSELLVGDKNALLVAARILSYGKDYEVLYKGETYQVDLSTVEAKPLSAEILSAKDGNRFQCILPATGITLTFKLLTHGDEQKIDAELKGLRKINKDFVPELSVRYKNTILAVDGNSDIATIREFVDKKFLAADARAFRKFVKEIEPDIDLVFYPEGESGGGVPIPIGITFLWPDFGA